MINPPGPVRILFLNQYYWPDEAATAQLLFDLVEAAAGQGHEVVVVASDRSYASGTTRYPRREERGSVRIRRVAATAFGRGSRLGRVVDYVTYLGGALVACLAGPRPAVVVGLSTPPILGALAVVVAKLRGAKSCYWAMDVYPDVAFALGALREGSLAGRLFGALSRWTLRKADLVVALGETMARHLERGGARRVVTVHNWSDEASVVPTPPSSAETHPLQVLYSGNLGLAHEFETVLEAASRTAGAARFVFVGGGPRRAEVESAVRSRGLGNVEFRGAVPRQDLGASLASAPLHLVTLQPGMPGLLVPSKLYGILAAGRAVLYVGPAEGETHDLIAETGCGFSVRNGDVDGVVRLVERLRADPSTLASAGAVARRVFEERFTKAGQTAAFLGILRSLASSGE
ncbi:MAG: glycosyltransferase family 4 protein [Acidobacteria bacterium]|nr:glycosyltransferase family 4 protein [Acidobacteriota bacterium]